MDGKHTLSLSTSALDSRWLWARWGPSNVKDNIKYTYVLWGLRGLILWINVLCECVCVYVCIYMCICLSVHLCVPTCIYMQYSLCTHVWGVYVIMYACFYPYLVYSCAVLCTCRLELCLQINIQWCLWFQVEDIDSCKIISHILRKIPELYRIGQNVVTWQMIVLPSRLR